MKSLYQWLKQHYYKNALTRSERDLEMLEKMFAARKMQIQDHQDALICKLWTTYPRNTQEALPIECFRLTDKAKVLKNDPTT